MSPRTDFVRPERFADGAPSIEGPIPATLFAYPQRRPRGIDRGALCVQITLCIVVSALLFSVIALPKIRAGRARSAAAPVLPAAVHGR